MLQTWKTKQTYSMEEIDVDCLNNLLNWREQKKDSRYNRPFTHCSQVDRFNETNYRKKKLNDFFFSLMMYKKKQKNFKKFRRRRKRINRRCTLKRKTTKKMCREDYFRRRRADEDRPVSVPVGSCCLELFDADCDGCIWWISFGVRR